MLSCHCKHLKFALTGFCLLVTHSASAITVVSGASTLQMQTDLTGPGVTITNLTITNTGCGVPNPGVGRFTNGTTAVGAGPVLGVPTGVVVSSGAIAAANRLDSSNNVANVRNILCAAAVNDPDMVLLEPATVIGEYAAIEFDVIPQFGVMAIPFQFGSDEFPEYVCSNFNDVIGIFVSGPGITSTAPVFSSPPATGTPYENYGKTSTGNLSSINWVNTGVVGQNGNIANCGSLANAAFYSDNSSGNPTGGNATVATTNANLEMDGFTNTLFQPINVVAGQTYHVKIAVADAGDLLWDSAAFIQPLFSTSTFSGFDYADAPNSYATLTTSGGPNHGIDNTIYMGAVVPDNEITGIPSVNADGDDLNSTDDEDGVGSFPALVSSATSYSVNVNVTNNSASSARLVGWIDFNRNGSFESGEGTQTNVANGTTGATVALNWPAISGLVAGNTYARIRFSSDPGLSIFTTGSAMSDGEVEDYPLPVLTVNFDKYVSTNATCSDTLDTLTVTPGTNVYYCYTVSNPNAQSIVINAGNTSDDQGHDISGLEQSYVAAAAQTVVVGPIVAGSAQLPTGSTTVNNAQVIATISGTDVIDNETASVTVSVSPPASGIKQLYFDTLNTTPNLSRIPPAAGTATANVDVVTLNQGLAFQAPFAITAGNTVNVQLRLRRRNGGGNRSIQVDLFNGASIIGTNTQTLTGGGWQTMTIPINMAPAANFVLNDFVRVVVSNIPASNGNIQLSSLQGGIRSELQMQTNTVINIDSIDVFSAAYPATTQFSSYAPGSSVFIRATVSDPFGFADITGANITVTDPTPAVLVNNAAMTSEPTPTGAIRVYEFPYPIPAAPDGFWNISVTATEGLETVPITHTATSTMIVGSTNINISKNSAVLSDPVNATAPKAIPGAIVEYSIAVENSGFGYVDINTFELTDPIPPETTFYFGSPLNPVTFIDGAIASGLSFTFTSLASTTDDIEFYNDGGAGAPLSFVTPTIDANGFDTTSPPIDFIRIIPKGEFNGGDGTNKPSMEIKFRVRVE